MEFVICRNLFGISRILPKIRHYNSMKGGNFYGTNYKRYNYYGCTGY